MHPVNTSGEVVKIVPTNTLSSGTELEDCLRQQMSIVLIGTNQPSPKTEKVDSSDNALD